MAESLKCDFSGGAGGKLQHSNAGPAFPFVTELLPALRPSQSRSCLPASPSLVFNTFTPLLPKSPSFGALPRAIGGREAPALERIASWMLLIRGARHGGQGGMSVATLSWGVYLKSWGLFFGSSSHCDSEPSLLPISQTVSRSHCDHRRRCPSNGIGQETLSRQGQCEKEGMAGFLLPLLSDGPFL